ncbi:MAG: hypothetical protein ACP5JG_15330 [Anaerolineae bacterium]
MLEEPVSVTIHYTDWDVRVVSNESRLTLNRWSAGGWHDAAQTCDPASTYVRDTANNALTAPICHLSRFALFGPTHRLQLPFLLRD